MKSINALVNTHKNVFHHFNTTYLNILIGASTTLLVLLPRVGNFER